MLDGLQLLGDAAPSPDRLRELVGAQLGTPVGVEHTLRGTAREVDYDVPAITTAGRWWVRGEADTREGTRPFAFFVKAVRPWERSPLFQEVPEPLREAAARSFPWRTEPAVYRSDLSHHLPDGLRMPRVFAVEDLPGPMIALWLQAVEVLDVAWDRARYARAAHLLGRLAASPATRARARVGAFHLDARMYVRTRISMQVVPILGSPVWEHPGLAAFESLRQEVLDTLPGLTDLAEEADAFPRLAGHGDACPHNLLVDATDPDGFVLIDYGLWNAFPLGHDLTQLLVGDVQVGRRAATDLGGLAELDDILLAAYAEGLAAEGQSVDPATLRRAHALQLFLFAGLSSLPFELLDLPLLRLREVAEQRAAVTRFSLDLLTQSAQTS